MGSTSVAQVAKAVVGGFSWRSPDEKPSTNELKNSNRSRAQQRDKGQSDPKPVHVPVQLETTPRIPQSHVEMSSRGAFAAGSSCQVM